MAQLQGQFISTGHTNPLSEA